MIVIQTLTRDRRKSQPLDLEVSESSMDRKQNKKKRGSSDEDPEVQDDSKRSCPMLFPFPTGSKLANIVEHSIGEVVNRFIVVKWPEYAPVFRQEVSNEIKMMVLDEISKQHESGKEVTAGSGRLIYRLCIRNSIAPLMFANDEIKSENGEPLEVAICDATNLDTINSSPLSSASIEFFILDGEFDYEKRRTSWTSSDFNQKILTSRKNKPPLILGNDQLYLQDGVCFVKKLIVTDNSSWTKSKMFCLGVKIKDKLSLEFGMIGEAVSQPFRVLTDRMRGMQKRNHPSREDAVWRLEGIRKDGPVHKSLLSCKEISEDGIKTVGDFLEAYRQKGFTYLKNILGRGVSERKLNEMVEKAEKCGVDVPNSYDQTFQKKKEKQANHLVETMVQADDPNQNFEVDQQNQSFKMTELGENEVEDNSSENFKEWLSRNIHFEGLSPHSHSNEKGYTDTRTHECSQEL